MKHAGLLDKSLPHQSLFEGMPSSNLGKETSSIALHAVRWALTLALLVGLAYAAIEAHASTPPCGAHKPCVVERTHLAQRSLIERDGVKDDLADSIVDRSGEPRYWLRCWQRGILITERITKTPPPESKRVSEVTGHEDSAIKVFDLKNATCLMERLPAER